MPRLLDEVRILGVSSSMPGALAGMLLADAGAKILRVEPPEGDPLGANSPPRVWNRGKQSMTLDLKQTDGRQVLECLAAHADVLLENFQPGEADRLAIGYEAMHAQFPQLGYGEAQIADYRARKIVAWQEAPVDFLTFKASMPGNCVGWLEE